MENIPSKEFICHGGFATADLEELHAGAISAFYSCGSLRYISVGNIELLRMIYPAVRDRNWLTLEPEIIEESIINNGSSFSVSIKCLYRHSEIEFSAAFLIEGREDNSITFLLRGEALSSFEKNRIGFCVLHPVEGCTGKRCLVIHPDGTKSQNIFPEMISPHQVFKNIRAMEWTAAHRKCSLTFEGDIFETEDQRNWTDASFKTYSTPLSLPYPVRIEKGTLINQKVSFRTEDIQVRGGSIENTIRINILSERSKKLPSIGIGRATNRPRLTDAEVSILRPLGFDHLRIDIHLFREGWEYSADEAIQESEMLICKCEFALFFSDRFIEETSQLLAWLKNHRNLDISCVLVYHKDYPTTPAKLADFVIPVLIEYMPGIKTGTGTNANFAQLNRNRPDDAYASVMCFSMHPQEHASDNLTLVENLAAQAYAIESALSFSDKRGVWISPVNIQRRFNANLASYGEPDRCDEYPPNTDARMMSLFGACWTAISLKYICESEVAGITFYETAGERGIIQGEYPSRWPSRFPAGKGTIFPVYHIFRYLLKYKNFRIVKSKSTHPLLADSLVLSDGEEVRMLAVNFTGKEQRVVVTGCIGVMNLFTFDYRNYEEAAMNKYWGIENEEFICGSGCPMTLLPWSVTFIKSRLKH